MTNSMSIGFATNYGSLECNDINKINMSWHAWEPSVSWYFSVCCCSIWTGHTNVSHDFYFCLHSRLHL